MTEKDPILTQTTEVPSMPDISGFSTEFQNAVIGLIAAGNKGQLQSIEKESTSEGRTILNEKTE